VSRDEPAPRVYYPELDGLRFWAFLSVFLFHQGLPSARVKSLAGATAARVFRENGWVGVQIFFVLSGYLITTLLLREEREFGRVDLRAFWVRRVLRIWPLYYLTVVLAFVVLPGLSGDLATPGGRENLARHLPAFLLFLGNWSMIARGPVTSDAQSVLWSVCVEEQFYLVVPLVVAAVRPRLRVGLVGVLIASAVALRAALAGSGCNQLTIQYNTLAQFDTLLGGVLLALLLDGEGRVQSAGRWVAWLQWPLYAAALWVLTRTELGHGPTWRRTWDFVAVWATAVGLVAVIRTVPGGLAWSLRRPRLVELGRISYGLYMYHEVALWLVPRLAERVGWFPFDHWLLPAAALALTVLLARFSYQHLERRFLDLKRRWTRVSSRPVS